MVTKGFIKNLLGFSFVRGVKRGFSLYTAYDFTPLVLFMSVQAPSLQVRPADGYAGDITPEIANEWMQSGAAVMIDVRTEAELAWVGFVPGAVSVPWKKWPGMAMNPAFDDAVRAAAHDKKIVLLCRSGVRSIAAAQRATELGLEAYNILEGFEGDANPDGHRGTQGGWRMRGLPWRQN